MQTRKIIFVLVILIMIKPLFASANTGANIPDFSGETNFGIDLLGGLFPMPLLELGLNHSDFKVRAAIASAIYWGKVYAEIAIPISFLSNADVYVDVGGFYAGIAAGKYGEVGVDFKKKSWRINLKVGVALFYEVDSAFGSSEKSQVVLPRIGFIWR